MIRESRRQAPPCGGPTEAGFTLVEVLIAMTILSFGIIAVTNLFLVAATSNVAGSATTTSAALASEHMDTLKAAPFTDASLTAGTYNDTTDVPGVGRIVTTWEVVDVGINTKFIRVRSQVQGGIADARSRAEFTTFRSCTFLGPPANCPP